jgi:two-component sensor histidine kinase
MVGTVDRDAQFLKIEHLSLPADVIAWARKLGNLWPEEIIIPRRLWPTDKAITERAPVWDSDPIGSISRMFPLLPKYIFIKAFEMAGMSLDDQICYLPMVMDEDVVGILAVWGPDLKNDDIPALTVFSNQVASAIKSTTLYNHAQEEIITRREAEAKIQTALNEKEVLLREIHHRVKNNLQVVSSLLNLQAAQSKDPSYVEGLRESQNRVRAMALIHEKLYQSDDLARINFAPYMQGLVSFLSQTYRISQERVNIRLEIRDTLLGLDTAIPCGLIVNELVSNALKYAFPDGNRGMITITCRPLNDGEILLEVADNGIGLPQGVIPAQSNSLGLKLVSGLVKQIDGTMSVESNDGLHYRIHFPLPA